MLSSVFLKQYKRKACIKSKKLKELLCNACLTFYSRSVKYVGIQRKHLDYWNS